MERDLDIEIVITASLDTRYIAAIESTPQQQAEHLCNLIAEALFGESQATLLMGPVRVTVVTADGYQQLALTRRGGDGFETEEQIANRFKVKET